MVLDLNIRTSPHLRGIVLAGSSGRRSPRHYSAGRLGPTDGKGASTPLGPLLHRAARLIPPERLLAVLVRAEASRYAADLATFRGDRVVQPSWRGSAAAVFLAALRIAHEEPDATIVVLPEQQLRGHEEAVMSGVATATRAVEIRPDVTVIIGARPHGPDRGQSWIEPGRIVEGLERFPVRTITRFIPSPSATEAAALFHGSGLLSTLVVVSNARTLIELGRNHLPDVLEALEPLEQAFGGPEESLLVEALYESMPHVDLSAVLLQHVASVGVLAIPDVRWSEGRSTQLPLAS